MSKVDDVASTESGALQGNPEAVHTLKDDPPVRLRLSLNCAGTPGLKRRHEPTDRPLLKASRVQHCQTSHRQLLRGVSVGHPLSLSCLG